MWRTVGIIVLVVVVVAVIAAIVYRQTKGEDGFSFELGKKEVEQDEKPFFEAARRDDLELVVDATGTTEPISDIEVKSEATGRITEFYVEEGDTVVAGDLICKLDQSNQLLVVRQREIAVDQARLAYQETKEASSVTSRASLVAAVEGAQATVDSAQEALDNTRARFERIAAMHKKGYATDQEYEDASNAVATSEISLESAKASLNSAQTQLQAFEDQSDQNSIEQARLYWEAAKVALEEARKQLGDSVITSPIDGIILEKLLDIGDSVVSINSSYGGGNTIVKVADMSKIQVRTSVDEIDIGKIMVGQESTVTVDAYFEREFNGVVTNVYPQGVSTGQGLVSFISIIEVDNTEGLLLGNMTASVKIKAQVLEDVLLIPLAATRAGEKPDTTIVYVLNEDEDPYDEAAEAEEREVELGDTDYYDIVVLDGVDEGEQVKVRGFASSLPFGNQ